MPPPLILRIITDATQTLKTNDVVMSSYTRMGATIAETSKLSAAAEIRAGEKAIAFQRTRVAALQAANAKLVAGSDAAIAGRVALANAESKLNHQTGVSSVGIRGSGAAAKEAERDVGKLTRGLLAGSGVASSLGRSLAFASTGFIAVAGTATLITQSVKAAEELAAAQHRTDQQLKTGGKSWDQYGARITATVDKLRTVAGFTDTELLQAFSVLFRATNNVDTSLRFMGVAANAARALQKPLASTSVALGKALGGNLSALRRLGVSIPQNLKGMAALNFVQEKFAGQAAASTTASQRFSAELEHSEAIIGTALLPTFTRLVGEFGDWLSRMNQSGRLQRDVNEAVTAAGYVFHTLGDAIGVVDKITGSFGNTLKLAFGIFAGREILKAVLGVDKLAASWLGVAAEANAATAAEERATAAGAGAGLAAVGAGAAGAGAAGALGGSALFGGLAAKRAAQQAEQSSALRSRIAPFINRGEATVAEEGVAAIGGAAVVSSGKVAALRASLTSLSKLSIAAITIPIVVSLGNRAANALSGTGEAGRIASDLLLRPALFHPVRAMQDFGEIFGGPSPAQIAANQRAQDAITERLSRRQYGPPAPFAVGGRLGLAVRNRGLPPKGFDAGVTPFAVYSKYSQTITEQIATAQAALTRTTKDDVATAKSIIARIKRLIDRGHLKGASLVQALQDEATQQGVLDSARQKEAQKAARIAAAKKAAASSYETPIDIQLAQARAELTATTADDIAAAKAAIAAAKRALASGKKNKRGQLEALQAEAQAQQTLDSLRQQSATTYTVPMRLQLALAREQALGTDQTATLKKMKAALQKALKASKGNIQKQIDIYNQIAGINAQLGSSMENAYGDYKKASLKWETEGMGLSPAQRRALEQRLSQVGPGGTHPMEGTGAAGYAIDPETGRPIHRHHRRQRGSDYGGGGAKPPTVNATIELTVNIDGKQVEATVTKRQQRRRRHNPTQRRGPNTATSSA